MRVFDQKTTKIHEAKYELSETEILCACVNYINAERMTKLLAINCELVDYEGRDITVQHKFKEEQ